MPPVSTSILNEDNVQAFFPTVGIYMSYESAISWAQGILSDDGEAWMRPGHPVYLYMRDVKVRINQQGHDPAILRLEVDNALSASGIRTDDLSGEVREDA